MGVFKSKAEKEMERKMLVKRTMNEATRFINKLEEQKKGLIEQAKIAKLKGIDSQYALAVSGLKTAIAQQKQAEAMKLNLQITSQLKDLSQMTGQFMSTMGSLSKEMTKIVDNTDFAKMEKEFRTAMMKSEEQAEKLGMFLEETEDSFKTTAANSSTISDSEIDRLIDSAAVDAMMDTDSEIEKELKKLDENLN